MSKLVVTEFITLDGVVEAPDQWSMAYWNDQIAEFKTEEMDSSGSLLLGRVTYQGFAAAWPSRTKEEGGDQMNGLPKYVASTTLKTVAWNNSRLLKGDLAEEVSRLKREPGKDILIYGSGGLVNSLMPLGLIDEYRLLVYPLVRRSGKRLFPEGGAPADLSLVEARSVGSGVMLLIYRPGRQASK